MTRESLNAEVVIRETNVVLGVTSAASLVLMRGLAEKLTGKGFLVHVVASGVDDATRVDADHVQLQDLITEREPSPRQDLASLWAWVRLLRTEPFQVIGRLGLLRGSVLLGSCVIGGSSTLGSLKLGL